MRALEMTALAAMILAFAVFGTKAMTKAIHDTHVLDLER